MAAANISKVEVSGKEFPIIEWKGERVLTLAMVDAMHGRQDSTASVQKKRPFFGRLE